MKQRMQYFTGLILLATSLVVQAVPISIFNTGVDSSGNVLATGLIDTHFTIQETGTSALVSATNSAWLANDSTSKWIWQNANGGPLGVTRTFRTTVDLTGKDPLSVLIDGRWSTDNFGDDILVNGVSMGFTSPTFGTWSNFSLGSNFVSGINTIDFVVRDVGVIAGFRAEFISATGGHAAAVPAPSAIALLVLGLAGLGFKGTRKPS